MKSLEVIRDERGGLSVIAAVSSVALVVAASAATMYGYQVATRSSLQAALDSGVLAGTALGASATEQERVAAATKAYEHNFGGNGSFITDNKEYWLEGGKAVQFTANKWVVSGAAQAQIANPFGGIVGDKKLLVGTKASATKMDSDPICMLGLNPNLKETIDMVGQPVINVKGCAVQANSSSGAGINQKGKPTLNAKMIGTTGGYTGDGYSPQPIKGTIPVADPFKDLPFPPHSSCDFNNVTVSHAKKTLTPGVYCGGIRVKAGGEVTLNSGIYVMKDGPLWINGNGSIKGTEVMIGFTGPDATLYMEGSSSLDLTSPASGTYVNMQFMQEPGTGGDDLYFSVIGNNTFKFEGTLYMPTLDVWFGGGTAVAASSPSYAMVADKIWIQDQTVIDITYENKRNLPVNTIGRFKYAARLIK